jgi:uncharacterized glyoxalase superfamily protein PhnB
MTVTKLINNLMVENVAASADFYCTNLGFSLSVAVPDGSLDSVTAFEDGVEYDFAILANGAAELMLQSVKTAQAEFPDMGTGGKTGNILYMQVNDVEALYAKILDKVEIVKGLHESAYGMKEFYVKDPDGHILGFA